jgi:RNA polymerase sigma factor (TIGR02999 family)
MSSDTDVPALKALIEAADSGDKAAVTALFSTLYRELHRLADRQLRANDPGLTLGATSLLHEAYLNIAGRAAVFPDRARFFAYAARAMRGLIIDCVRERRALKRGGEFHLTTLITQIAEDVPATDEMAHLNSALEELAETDLSLAELVDLKYFCGLSFLEIAALRHVSERTVRRDWTKARLFLHHVLKSP